MGLYTLRFLTNVQCTVICTHHYSIIQSIFTALKILWALTFHPSLPSTPGNKLSFHCLQLDFFPECHLIGILQDVAFLASFTQYSPLFQTWEPSSHFSLANISVLTPISFRLGSSTFKSSRNGISEQVTDFTVSPVH